MLHLWNPKTFKLKTQSLFLTSLGPALDQPCTSLKPAYDELNVSLILPQQKPKSKLQAKPQPKPELNGKLKPERKPKLNLQLNLKAKPNP